MKPLTFILRLGIGIRWSFALSVCILGVAAVFAYYGMHAYTRNNALVNRTTNVLLALEHVISTVKDAETGQRGYLLTRDLSFLEPYHGARERTAAYLDTVTRLTADNPEQQRNLQKLRPFIVERYERLQMTLDTASGLHYSHAKLYPNILRGKQIMDSARIIINAMEHVELQLLAQRETSAENSQRLTRALLTLFFMLALFFITAFFLLVNNELKKRMRLTERLNENLAELDRSNRELEQYAFVASHDMQEPLRKILIFGDRLQSATLTKLNPSESKYLDKMMQAAARMRSLITDAMAYARVNRGEHAVTRCDLNAVAQDVMNDLELQIHDRHARVMVAPLPAVQADPLQMRQLFMNMMSNALKFHKPGKQPVVTVSCTHKHSSQLPPHERVDPTKDYYAIAFTDNGIGFDEEHRDKMFRLFQRLHASDAYPGTGIGLALCEKVADNHGGFIVAEGKVDVGAVFTVYLPVS